VPGSGLDDRGAVEGRNVPRQEIAHVDIRVTRLEVIPLRPRATELWLSCRAATVRERSTQ
jgi:hypothetical protein